MTKTTGSILLVDDEAKIREALAKALREEGHEVVATGCPREVQGLLSAGSFDVLLVDNLMPELTGLDLIRELVAATPAADRPQILLMTAHATVESAIEAMKLGALDYLQKPFEIDELLVVVNRALDHQRLQTQHGYLLSERDEEFNQYGIVGRSRRVQDVIKTAQMVAKSKSTVLITGETGTGKEMVARAIHFHSAQREMPLVKVNCAAIPENLLESELFAAPPAGIGIRLWFARLHPAAHQPVAHRRWVGFVGEVDEPLIARRRQAVANDQPLAIVDEEDRRVRALRSDLGKAEQCPVERASPGQVARLDRHVRDAGDDGPDWSRGRRLCGLTGPSREGYRDDERGDGPHPAPT